MARWRIAVLKGPERSAASDRRSLALAVAARRSGIVSPAVTANITTEHEPLGRVPAWLLWQEAALMGNLALRTRRSGRLELLPGSRARHCAAGCVHDG
jgi:hypothetical protein